MKRKFDLEAFRFKVREKAPYFGSVLWSLRPVKSDFVTYKDEKGTLHSTLGVDDQGRLHHGEYVDWTFKETVGVLTHEIMHVVLRDSRRRMGRDPGRWNVACDLAINSILEQGQWTLPKDGQFPKLYGWDEGLTAEQYYALLVKNQIKIPVAVGLSPGNGRCGGCAGNPEPGEGEGQGGNGSSDDVPGLSGIELDAIAIRIAQEVVKSRGSVPGALSAWADELLNPTVPWQTVLRSAVKRCVTVVSGGASDYSFMHTNARRDSGDLIPPKLVTYKPEVFVGIDTSGSMSEEELREGVGEVHGVVRHLAQRITVACCDAAMHEVYKIHTPSQLVGKKLGGRGGTDMRVVMDYASHVNPRPNIIIIFTDGETPWPEAAPRGSQVVVCLTSKAREDTEVPSWARLVRVGGQK
jgi:predicted metal-dependent peptidase